MHTRLPSSIALIFAITLSSALFAADLPDLPEAFDAGWKGEKPCEVLYETNEVRVARCTFAPGTGHEKHFHYPHFGYVLQSGTMRITSESGEVQDRQTNAGISWSSEKVTQHEVLNIGDTITSYLIVEPQIRPMTE
jgi:quercetin dioxygenase-like cupin family protein